MSARCSTALQKEIDKNRDEMTGDIAPLLLPSSAIISPDEDVEEDPESSSVDAGSRKIPGKIPTKCI